VLQSTSLEDQLLTLTYLPVILVSGTFGSLSSEPRWLTSLAAWLPAEPMIDAATYALRHTSGPPALAGHDLVVLAAWAAAGLVASLVLFRWQPRATSGAR
jgi:ABC-type multidrug transport system permease subunit